MFQSVITFSLEDNLDSLLATTETGFCNVRQDGLPYMGVYDPILWVQVRGAMHSLSPRKREKVVRKWCRRLADTTAKHFGDPEKWGRHYYCAAAYWQFANDPTPWQAKSFPDDIKPGYQDALIRDMSRGDTDAMMRLAAYCRTLYGNNLADTLYGIADRLTVAYTGNLVGSTLSYAERSSEASDFVENTMENLWFNIAPVEEQRRRYSIHCASMMEHAKLLGIY